MQHSTVHWRPAIKGCILHKLIFDDNKIQIRILQCHLYYGVISFAQEKGEGKP